MYNFVSLFLAGLIVGLLYPRNILVAFFGIIIGQFIYMLAFLPLGPLLSVGLILMLGFGLLSMLGTAFGVGARNLLKRAINVSRKGI